MSGKEAGASGDAGEAQESGRMKQYKNMGKHEDMRRRRTECSVELRKQKRADEQMKRRNVDLSEQFESEESSNEQKTESPMKTPIPKMTVPEAIEILKQSPTIEQMRVTFEAMRRLLSRTKTPPVDEVISSGLIVAFVQALGVPDEKVQFEAAWSITNVVSGSSEQTLAAVNQGAVPALVQLCHSKNRALAEQSLWAIANVVGDSAQLRDHAIECGLIEALDHLMATLRQLSMEFIRTLAWTYSNLCRHKKPMLSLQMLARLAPSIVKLLSHQDKAVRQDACWALSYLTDGSDDQITVASEAKCLPVLLNMVKSGSDTEVAPAVRVFGNFATGNDQLTQMVVDAGILALVPGVINKAKSMSIQKECCWMLSNIIAGTQRQIQAVLDASLLPILFIALRDGDFRSKFESSWAVSNLACGGSAAQVINLAEDGCLEVMCGLLEVPNTDFVCNILDTLLAVLKCAQNIYPDKLSRMQDTIEGCGGLDKLETLQQNENQRVYDASYKIIEEFFNDEEEENQTEEMPTTGNEPIQF